MWWFFLACSSGAEAPTQPAASAEAAPPVAATPALEPKTAGPVTAPLVVGEARANGVGAKGLHVVHAEALSQTLYWEPIAGPLADTAAHELGLINEAIAGQGGTASAEPATQATAGGQPALAWSASMGTTEFHGLALDCAGSRVVLSSFGPPGAEVRDAHQASRDGLVCGD